MVTKKGKKTTISVYKTKDTLLTGIEVNYVNDGCVFFFNAQHKLLMLNTLERGYFDFMCEKMNARNLVELNSEFREKYLDFCNKILGPKVSRTQRSFVNFENKLKELGLIFQNPENKRLQYVNPKHVFKGSLWEREALLRKLLKIAVDTDNKELLKQLIDKPVEVLELSDELLSLPMPEDYISTEEIRDIRPVTIETKPKRVRYLKNKKKPWLNLSKVFK